MNYAHEDIKPYNGKESKTTQVRRMFNEIAHSYDKLNHTLSLGIDRIWRKEAIDSLSKHSRLHLHSILDIATGTGDFAILAMQRLHPDNIIGIDIADEMLALGRQKIEKEQLAGNITLQNENCERMSFADNQFDAIISSFGLRNFQNLDICLSEMKRVLKPGGSMVIIDLCTPTSFPMNVLFWCYKHAVMPVIGRLVSHDNHAYTYLPETMDAIPQGKSMQKIFEKAGFCNVQYKRQLFGMSMLYSMYN